MSPSQYTFLGAILAVLILWAFANRVLKWDRKANQPMAITLTTSQTPAQVVAKDRQALLAVVFAFSLRCVFSSSASLMMAIAVAVPSGIARRRYLRERVVTSSEGMTLKEWKRG
jgi:hypothetical protein